MYFTQEHGTEDGKAITEICRKNTLVYFIVSWGLLLSSLPLHQYINYAGGSLHPLNTKSPATFLLMKIMS